MTLITYATLFVLGAIFASFAGVVAARIHTGQSFFSGRSRCDACDTTLAPSALVPIISYFAFGGRARCCNARVSLASPLSEILLGGLFVLSYNTLGFTLPLIPFTLSLSLLLALVLYDLAHQILPPSLMLVFVAMSALSGYALAPSPTDFLFTFYVALLIGSSLALINLISGGRAMGLSDAPLAFGLALLTGPAALSGFVFSFWIGAVIGIGILFTRPVGHRMGVEVPFAPFLMAGFLLAYFTQWNLFALTTMVLP